MSDLVAFLSARLDEDETYLRDVTAIGERQRDAMSEADLMANMPAVLTLMSNPVLQQMAERQVALGYLPPNDATRLLAEVAAKRAILAEHPHERTGGRTKHRNDIGCTLCHQDDGAQWTPGYCVTIRALAAVYSGHPDYREEWKP